MDSGERIAHGYFFAKNYVIKKGYGSEIDWQDELNYDKVTEQTFLEQFSWVVIASGMNDKVVRKIFPAIKKIMFDFASSQKLYVNEKNCMRKALKVLNHPGKIKSIFYVVDFINKHSFEEVRSRIKIEGISFIQTFPYMGKATSYHLAKNLGLNVVKPDRHLIRISNLLGYDSPDTFCQLLASQISEKLSLIDLVLWRYATLDRNYIKNISWYINSHRTSH